MLAVTRKNKIRDIVLEEKSVTVAKLAVMFSVTEETIRRDLKALEDEGFLTRAYGGAFIQDGVQNDISLSIRETVFVESKKIIARRCAETVRNGDSIFVDSSTTSSVIAEAVQTKRITVLTNCLKTMNMLASNENIHLIGIGGAYSRRSMAFLGRCALQDLDNYFVDKAFISCRTLSMSHGITDSNEQSAELRQKVIARANETYLVADYSKFEKVSFVKICDFSAIQCLVTDKPLTPAWREFLAKNDVRLMDADAPAM